MIPAALVFIALAAAPLSEGFIAAPEGPEDEMTEAERALIWEAIEASRAGLSLPKAGERPSFRWPLRAARGYSQPGFVRISNYVDHDPLAPGQLRDYNCGTRTYDRDNGYNHQGIDISIWPDPWNTMQAGQVEIIAAAPGTIVLKSDGHPDQSCVNNTGTWNAVYVQHDDGSVAWYGHMKTGSLTTKPVGARVAAGEYLGNVGSSGNSLGPHLHLEVYDPGRRLVDPFQGTCNLKNADSWWAEQPPYFVTRVNRAFTASAPPAASSCGANGQNEYPGSLNAKSAFAPGEVAYFVAAVRDMQPGQAVTFTIRKPDGSVWRTRTGTAATQYATGTYWWSSYTLDAAGPFGTWMAEMELAGSRAETPFTVMPDGGRIDNFTDLWWNPSEPGWGVNINHQAGTLFATWFTYDTDGNGMWLVMPDTGLGRGDGAIYRATGVPLAQINGAPAANFPLPRVGTGTFEFLDPNRATFRYNVNGIAQTKALQRQAFSTATTCVETRGGRASATNYQDLWWNPAESGWGINLTHQGEIIFATWFTYGAGGRGQWLVASDARRQATGEFRGRLYRTTGRPFGQIAGAPAITGSPVDVGEITLTFADGEHGRLDYTVDGVTQSKPITRQLFAGTAPLCR